MPELQQSTCFLTWFHSIFMLKVENKEKMILDSKEKMVFYREKMQDLVSTFLYLMYEY